MTQSNESAQSETIAQQMDVIRADIARLTAMIAERSSHAAGDAKETVKSVSQEARARADAYRIKAGEQASQAYETGQEMVRKHPVAALGLALGAGALLGRAILRR